MPVWQGPNWKPLDCQILVPHIADMAEGLSPAERGITPMSASVPADLDRDEQAARISRSVAETQKLVAEQNKLFAEQLKLNAEQTKLSAEADKLRRDRFLAPVVTAAAVAGAVSALLPLLLRSWGFHL